MTHLKRCAPYLQKVFWGIYGHIYVTIYHPVLRHEMIFGGTFQENDASY